MSRTRPIQYNGEVTWFDRKNPRATAQQLELLAAIEDIDVDDLLDAGLTQAIVLDRCRQGLHGDVVPEQVLDRLRRAKREAASQPVCRICSVSGEECEGRITRHHFINRWLMRELSNYESFAARSRCCIPICVGKHRDLHQRDDADKSIAKYMTVEEKAMAVKILDQLKEERPILFDLILGGDAGSYEYQLVRDYSQGLFHRV